MPPATQGIFSTIEGHSVKQVYGKNDNKLASPTTGTIYSGFICRSLPVWRLHCRAFYVRKL